MSLNVSLHNCLDPKVISLHLSYIAVVTIHENMTTVLRRVSQ